MDVEKRRLSWFFIIAALVILAIAAEKCRQLVGDDSVSKSGKFVWVNCFDMSSGTLACMAKEGGKLYVYNLRSSHVERARTRAIEIALTEAITGGLSIEAASKQAQQAGKKAAKLASKQAKRITGPILAAGWDFLLLTYFACPFGMRVEQSLHLKGVNYENIQVNVREKSDILLRSNPVFKKMPVLIHKGKPICESLIIVEYIDETWPSSPRMLSLDPYERALARFWADFIDKQVFVVGRQMILSSGESHEKAKEKLKNGVETIDGTLKKLYEEEKGPLFGGENVNAVDIVLGPLVVSKSAYEAVGKYDLGGAEQLPNLFKWMEAFMASPAAAVLPHADEMEKIYVTVHNDFQARGIH